MLEGDYICMLEEYVCMQAGLCFNVRRRLYLYVYGLCLYARGFMFVC